MILKAPAVVVLSSTDGLLERTRSVLEPRGFSAAGTTLNTVRQDLTQYRPAVLFIDYVLYEFDPSGFDTLVRETNTKLAVVNNPRDAESLLQRLINPANASGLYTVAAADSSIALLEADTKKYDSKTVHSQLEKMRELGEADTVKLDRETVQAQVRALHAQQAGLEKIRYDRKSLLEKIDRLRAGESSETPALARDDDTKPSS